MEVLVMRMKRIAALGMTGIILSMSFVMPVSAHGHHNRQTSVKTDVKTNTVCELCPVEDCTRTGLHVHDNVTYCGYAHGGGYCDGSCGAVAVCAVEGCAQTGYHSHNEQTYC